MQLEALQNSMMDAIDLGPDYVLDGAYLGGRAAVSRGLRVHANTISHARLVALEETYPRTLELLGNHRFNALCRRYVESGLAGPQLLQQIGDGFPQFLAQAGELHAEGLALFEWAWLEAYHAGEADPLELPDLAGLDEERLLATQIARHPAARIAPATRNPALNVEVPGLSQAAAILLTRPQVDVLVTPATRQMVLQFENLGAPQTICNLLATAPESSDEDGLQSLLALLNAGSLVLTDSRG